MADPGLSLSARDIIKSALRLIGVLASGETPDDADAADSLVVLNHMMDSWNAERLMIFTLTISEFSLAVGKQTYTLGTGGDFNVARPARIERMGIVSLTNPAQPLELPIEMLTDQQWSQVPVKLISSTLPLQCYDDGAYPLRNLTFRYIPQIAVNVRIYGWTALSTFADLSTLYTFPPGYFEAIRYNLAIRLAPEFQMDIAQMPQVTQLAADAISKIKRINAPLIDLSCDQALMSGGKEIYNWLTDNAGR